MRLLLLLLLLLRSVGWELGGITGLMEKRLV